MKYLPIFFMLALSFQSFSQNVHMEVEAGVQSDTALLITGGNHTALSIHNEATSIYASSSIGSAIQAISTAGRGVYGISESSGYAGVSGRNNQGYGVYGATLSPTHAGVTGTNFQGNGVYGTSAGSGGDIAGVKGSSANAVGVIGISNGSYGVKGESNINDGIYAVSTSGTGLHARSSTGNALRAVSLNSIAAKFTAGNGNADIVFPVNLYSVNGTLIPDRNGIIASDEESSRSGLIFRSNLDVTIKVDNDGNSENGSFQVRNSAGQNLLQVDETFGTEIRGILELKALDGGDNGRIESAQGEGSSDLIIDSHDDIVLILDSNGGEDGELRVENSSNTVIFRLFESGNLNIAGTLNQGSDINRKHNIIKIKERDILNRIHDLPVYKWQYIGEDISHIGPMAQDFFKSFGLGIGETSIASVDADGIALAGVKALIIENRELKEELGEIKKMMQTIIEGIDLKK